MSDLCKEFARLGRGIGNENRYRILETLMKGPLTVGAIAKKTSLPQPAASQHLKILKAANLVEDRRQGQEVVYAINVAYMTSLLKKLVSNLPRKNNT